MDARTIAAVLLSNASLKPHTDTAYHNEELKSLTRYRFDKVAVAVGFVFYDFPLAPVLVVDDGLYYHFLSLPACGLDCGLVIWYHGGG